jgi:hypothetical protein
MFMLLEVGNLLSVEFISSIDYTRNMFMKANYDSRLLSRKYCSLHSVQRSYVRLLNASHTLL